MYAPCLKPKAVEQVVERFPVVEGLITIADASCARRQQSNQDDESRRQSYRRGPAGTACGVGLDSLSHTSQIFSCILLT